MLTVSECTASTRSHYGEEIAFYFAFMDLSNRALLPIALLGPPLACRPLDPLPTLSPEPSRNLPVGPLVFAVRFLARQYGSPVYAALLPFYAAAIVLWGSYFLMLWQRRRAELQVISAISAISRLYLGYISAISRAELQVAWGD